MWLCIRGHVLYEEPPLNSKVEYINVTWEQIQDKSYVIRFFKNFYKWMRWIPMKGEFDEMFYGLLLYRTWSNYINSEYEEFWEDIRRKVKGKAKVGKPINNVKQLSLW